MTTGISIDYIAELEGPEFEVYTHLPPEVAQDIIIEPDVTGIGF